MNKNWPEICKLGDPHLRLCISLTQDEGLIAKLQAAFPECFTTEDLTYPFPLSALRSLSDRCLSTEGGGYGDFSVTDSLIREKIGFPVTWFVGAASEHVDSHGTLPLPNEWQGDTYDELIGWSEENKFGFPRVLRRITVGNVEYYVGWVNQAEEDMYLYPCKLVDENS